MNVVVGGWILASATLPQLQLLLIRQLQVDDNDASMPDTGNRHKNAHSLEYMFLGA